jgi:hypothetical protein
MNNNVGTIILLTGSMVDTPLDRARQAKAIHIIWQIMGKGLSYIRKMINKNINRAQIYDEILEMAI